MDEKIEKIEEKEDRYSRSRIIFGDGFEKFESVKILVCGIGGVGGFVVDGLYRSGITNIVVVDKDSFDITNQNRQIGSESVGEKKVDVFKKLYPKIEPIYSKIDSLFLESFDLVGFDFVVDAIDDIDAKIALARRFCEGEKALKYGRYISSAGSAKKLNPLEIRVDSIWNSYGDKLAKRFRDGLKKSGFIGSFKVIFSPESPRCKNLGSFCGVTASFGLQIASEIIRDRKSVV